MEKIKYGIVGMGNQGSYYAELFQKGEIINGQLIAVCDNDSLKLEKAQNKFGEILYFDDYKEMLDSGEIDAVIVTTPHYSHEPNHLQNVLVYQSL